MDIEQQLQLITSFLDDNKILLFFKRFQSLLDETKNVIETEVLIDFLGCINFLEKSSILRSNNIISQPVTNNFLDHLSTNTKTILLSITDSFCSTYLNSILHLEDNASFYDSPNVAISFDLASYLLNICLTDICSIKKDFTKSLLTSLYNFFTNHKFEANTYLQISNYQNNILYAVLKYFCKLIKCISSIDVNYIPTELILKIIDNLPFSDMATVKVFVNQIIPMLLNFPNSDFSQNVLTKMWFIVSSQYKVNEDQVNSEKSSFYILLYNLSKHIFCSDEKDLKLPIYKDILFWEIVQKGLVSEISQTKKIAVNILKTFIAWVKNEGLNHDVFINTTNVLIFSVNFDGGIKVWDDIVTLLETLEEKQVHVIKPVLRKLTRIVELSGLSKRSDSCNYQRILDSSWMLILFQRMLGHGSRYIVKWTLDVAFSLDLNSSYISTHFSQTFIKILIEAISDQNLFSRTSEQDNFAMFLSSKKISIFLNSYIVSFNKQEEKAEFLKILIKAIASQSWSAVPLFHLISALSEMSSIPAWNSSDLLHIREIILNCQKGQEPIFREYLENLFLKCCSQFLDWDVVSFEDLANLLIIFKDLNNLQNENTWMTFALKLKNIFDSKSSKYLTIEKAKLYCEEEIRKIVIFRDLGLTSMEYQMKKFCRLLMILNDASFMSREKTGASIGLTWNVLLNPIISSFHNLLTRPCISLPSFFHSLQFFTFLIEKGRNCNKYETLVLPIVQCLRDCTEIVEFLFQKMFSDFESENYILKLKISFSFLHVSLLDPKLIQLFYSVIQNLIKQCEDIAKNEKLRRLLLVPFWTIVNTFFYEFGLSEKKHLIDSNKNDLTFLNHFIISEIMKNNLLQECILKSVDLNEASVVENLSFAENSICQFWTVCSHIIQSSFCYDLTSLLLPLINEVCAACIKGPKIAIPYAINCLQFIIPKLESQNSVKICESLLISWKACYELRGCDMFKQAMHSFIKTIFQQAMLQECYFETIYDYIEKFKMISENTLGILYSVINQFCTSFSIPVLINSKFNYIPILIQALTYGSIYQRGQKIMEDTLVYLIEDKGMPKADIDTCYTRPSIFVRITIINYMLKSFQQENELNEKFAFELIEGLSDVDNEQYSTRLSRFSNSLNHRIRNRAWQVICMLQPRIVKVDLNEKIMIKILDSWSSKTQQPSIRYMQEWVMFNILRTHKSLLISYLSLLQNLSERRASFIISTISVLYLLISQNILISKHDILSCFPAIIIQCMAHNFTVRLYAQFTLIKLFTFCQEKNLKDVISKYEFVLKLIEMHTIQAEQGNFCKNIEKLSNDFYFSNFNPITHFSLETIFYSLPRLCNLPPDEWIKPSLFDSQCDKVVPLYNHDDNLKNIFQMEQLFISLEDNNLESNDSLDYNFQRKICPLKDILGEDTVYESEFFIEKNNFKKESLIVVASLIDRIPNLGGLCRTCEVFGVQELVIGKLQYMEDKNFKNLAVSSDKWISIKEVKPHNLKEYLISMKEQNFVLVGAEQTENSCYLQDFVFPKKTILLLGHEKEGLPIDLIQLLDCCVEIPQQGVVRSLNVHVTGAILIWEYARQYLKKV